MITTYTTFYNIQVERGLSPIRTHCIEMSYRDMLHKAYDKKSAIDALMQIPADIRVNLCICEVENITMEGGI